MATIVERPLSVLSDTQVLPRQQPQQRRPLVEVEIIDVDQLDNIPSTSTFSRPIGPSREVIVIDSDDESVPQVQASARTSTARRRGRLISPPPPAPEPIQQPPVPPVPHRFAVLTGFPVNPRAPDAGTPPVIRPIERNFDLGGNTRPLSTTAVPAHPNRHRRPPIVAPRVEPEPHHIPALGLGGAIIALNDQGSRLNNIRDRNRRYLHNHIANNEEQHGLIDRGLNVLRRFYTTFARISPANGEEDDEFFPFAPLNAAAAAAAQPHRDLFRDVLLPRKRPEEDKYKVEYTHPNPPEPGYTFNFAPPEATPPKPAPIVIDLVGSDSEDESTAGPSKPSVSPIVSVRELLVCARCLDPLVLGGGLVSDEGRRRKVWALRCGHMIDGKCLDIVGVPEQENEQSFSGKGKGKSKGDNNVFASTENTVRSRLRSRVPPPPVPTMLPPTTTDTTPPTVLGKRKRNTKPRIEATHEWKCPVESCGRIHASVRIDRVWVPEPDKGPTGGKGKGKRVPMPAGSEGVVPGRGAIAVFV
ncbi:hypothetical protein C0995_007894 [Termitomyces sp. Mi166|nr:hypothetical protein C0995_007894 [Termitomyces sp. Mi166\